MSSHLNILFFGHPNLNYKKILWCHFSGFLGSIYCVFAGLLYIFVLNHSHTYKYYQVHESTDPTLELGPNRELYVDSQSIHPPNYIVLADGPFRVKYIVGFKFLTIK